MNAASRVIDGAAEGKDGKRHELRASSDGGRGHRLLQAAPLMKNRDLGARLLAPRLKRLRKNSFLASTTWRCTRRPRRPRLGGRAPARRQLASRELPPNLRLVMSVFGPMPTPFAG